MAYIPSRIKKHNTRPKGAKLNLTSMMDMFTIILVFLLKAYAAEGQLTQPSEDLSLPKSSIQTPPETALDLIVSKDAILVNDKHVAAMTDVKAQQGYIIESLKKELSYYSSEARSMEDQMGVPFSGKIRIQGDQDIEYKDLVKVMATCGASDYPNMRLVVYRKSDDE